MPDSSPPVAQPVLVCGRPWDRSWLRLLSEGNPICRSAIFHSRSAVLRAVSLKRFEARDFGYTGFWNYFSAVRMAAFEATRPFDLQRSRQTRLWVDGERDSTMVSLARRRARNRNSRASHAAFAEK